MAARFFIDSLIGSDQVTILGSEAHHLQHVRRARVGDVIALFDGSGREATARITSIRRAQVEVQILDTVDVDREPPTQLVVATALPKGERQRWLTEKLVELGVSELVPLRTSRSVVHPDQRTTGKLRRTVIEASKQCGRNRLMRITALRDFAEYVQAVPQPARRLLADPSGQPLKAFSGSGPETYLAVGPEGGFTAEELAAASKHGWQLVSLGQRILRVETACLVLAARTVALE